MDYTKRAKDKMAAALKHVILDPTLLECEAEEWVRHGFTPAEAARWVEDGYIGLSALACKLRSLGLSPWNPGCTTPCCTR